MILDGTLRHRSQGNNSTCGVFWAIANTCCEWGGGKSCCCVCKPGDGCPPTGYWLICWDEDNRRQTWNYQHLFLRGVARVALTFAPCVEIEFKPRIPCGRLAWTWIIAPGAPEECILLATGPILEKANAITVHMKVHVRKESWHLFLIDAVITAKLWSG